METFKMDSFFRTQTLLEDRRSRMVFRKLVSVALTGVLLGFSAKAFAEPVKLGYAALTAGQVAPWMAKEAGYFSKYGIEAELIYIPAVAATQALIAGEIQLAQVTGVSTSGAILAGADVRIIWQRTGPAGRLDLRAPGNQDTGGPQRKKTWDIEIRCGERNRRGAVSCALRPEAQYGRGDHPVGRSAGDHHGDGKRGRRRRICQSSPNQPGPTARHERAL